MEPLSIRRGKSQENYSNYRWMCERIKELEMLPDVFFCANDEIAVTLIRALREMGLMVPKDIKVVGFDATDDAVAAVKAGKMLATVAQQPDQMGKTAVDTAITLAEGETVEKSIPVEVKLVTKDSAE